jgi:hypothetical protein
LALANATALPVPVHEARDVDLRERDAHEILALTTDQLPLRDIPPEVLSYLATDDGPEPRMVLIDFQGHPA